MKSMLFGLLILFTLSCVTHTTKEKNIDVIEVVKPIEIEFAKGFYITQESALTKIVTHSNLSTYKFSDSIFINHNTKIDSNLKYIKKNYQSLALQSSTYLAYLKILNKLDLVKGISGLQYVNLEDISTILDENKTEEISINGSIQMESLLKVNPDLFLIYPFELENAEKYKMKGIQTLLISEYLEITPLARLEWIKLFGVIFNEVDKANQYFNDVKTKYLALKKQVNNSKKVFFNLPFNDNWNMPSSNSITANLVKDAGLNYIYSDTISDNAIRSKEQVWEDAINAEYWVIIASRPENYSLNDLLKESKIYANFRSVKNKNVIFCNTSQSPYFIDGVVEPDVLLENLIQIIENKDVQNFKYFHRLK